MCTRWATHVTEMTVSFQHKVAERQLGGMNSVPCEAAGADLGAEADVLKRDARIGVSRPAGADSRRQVCDGIVQLEQFPCCRQVDDIV